MNDVRVAQADGVESNSPFASWIFGGGVVLFYAAAFFLPSVFTTGVRFRHATNALAVVAGAALTAADRRSGNIGILFGVGFVQYLLTVVFRDAANAGSLWLRDFSLIRPVTVGLCCAGGGLLTLVCTRRLRWHHVDPRVSLRYLSPFQKAFSRLERTQKIIQTLIFFAGLLLTALRWLGR